MVGRCLMQADEMAAIEGEYDPRLAGGERQNVFIRDGLTGLAAFVSGQQVVAQFSLMPRQRAEENSH